MHEHWCFCDATEAPPVNSEGVIRVYYSRYKIQSRITAQHAANLCSPSMSTNFNFVVELKRASCQKS